MLGCYGVAVDISHSMILYVRIASAREAVALALRSSSGRGGQPAVVTFGDDAEEVALDGGPVRTRARRFAWPRICCAVNGEPTGRSSW